MKKNNYVYKIIHPITKEIVYIEGIYYNKN